MSVLDNPAWSTLSTTHASFAEGDELAKRYPADVAPIAGLRDQSSESYDSLSKLIGFSPTALTFSDMADLPAGWTVVRQLPNLQMVWQGQPSQVKHSIEDLDKSHIEEMLALTELNHLGRFRRRTPELGSYVGIHESGRLVAMAGEGFHFPGYTEVQRRLHRSRLSRPWIRQLSRHHLVQNITRRGETPFLHVRKDNVDAIRLYEKLGFKTRRAIDFVIVKKADSENQHNLS